MSAALLEPEVTDAASFAARVGASPTEMNDLERLHALLADWNGRINLVSASSLAGYWPRHVFDSAQLLRVAPAARTWVDIGAGAGFPGLVLAILLKNVPRARVHLVESQAKRCRFLEAAVAELGLAADVHNARAEALSLKADVVTARAVAPLVRLLEFAQPFMRRGAKGVFLKGQSAEAELAEARTVWRFTCNITPSVSDSSGRILAVEGLSRAR